MAVVQVQPVVTLLSAGRAVAVAEHTGVEAVMLIMEVLVLTVRS